MEKHEEMMYLNVLYELPDDDFLGKETRSNVEGHLLNLAMFDLRFLLLFYVKLVFFGDFYFYAK
jgi:hypothetical protein